MADETHKLKRAATEKMRAEPRREAEDEIYPEPQPDTPEPDATDVWKDRYLRLHADLENTKKRLARSSAQEVEAQKEALLRDLLPVADGLDLALMHTQDKSDNRGILQGIEMVRDILNKFFINHDVKAIDAWGKPFDPRLHQAIGVMRHPKFPPNTVVKVEQKGYLYGDKLLRPAQVVVTPASSDRRP
jgi:molecular chaperone GrpE